jgi:hypothetical protein
MPEPGRAEGLVAAASAHDLRALGGGIAIADSAGGALWYVKRVPRTAATAEPKT